MTKGDETRSAVLGAAVSLASEVGLEGVSIAKLAQRVGLSKSGLFAHFSSKENLQIELITEASRRFVDVVVAPGLRARRGEPRVRALFENWLDWPKANFLPGGCIFIAAAVEFDDKPGLVRDLLVSSQKDWLETITGAARIAVSEGHFRRDLDVHQFAHEEYSMAFGHHFISRLMQEPKSEARTHAAFDRLVRDAKS